MNQQQKKFLEQYLSKLTSTERDAIPHYLAEHFCGDEYNANECARLIDTNVKTASCALKSAYDIENEPLPQIGQLTVVLNWAQEPICIVQLTDISICPFNKVTREFAQSEGEGDGSYEWWHKAHINFFTEYAKDIGTTFNENSELVLERFEKVFPSKD